MKNNIWKCLYHYTNRKNNDIYIMERSHTDTPFVVFCGSKWLLMTDDFRAAYQCYNAAFDM